MKTAEAESQTADVIPLDTAFALLLDQSDDMDTTAIDAGLEALAQLERQAA